MIAEMNRNVAGVDEIDFDGIKIEIMDKSWEREAIVPLNAKKDEALLVKLDPPGRPGRDRLKVEFWIDERKRLLVTVTDLFDAKVIYKDMPVTDLK